MKQLKQSLWVGTAIFTFLAVLLCRYVFAEGAPQLILLSTLRFPAMVFQYRNTLASS
jgi:hypothetical protein